MYKVAAVEIVVIENLSEDKGRAMKVDGDEAMLFNVYNYLFSNNACCLSCLGTQNKTSEP